MAGHPRDGGPVPGTDKKVLFSKKPIPAVESTLPSVQWLPKLPSLLFYGYRSYPAFYSTLTGVYPAFYSLVTEVYPAFCSTVTGVYLAFYSTLTGVYLAFYSTLTGVRITIHSTNYRQPRQQVISLRYDVTRHDYNPHSAVYFLQYREW